MKGRIRNLTPRNRTDLLGKISPHIASTDAEKASLSIPRDQPRASSRINDNYCVTSLRARLLAGSTLKETLTVQSLKTHVKLNVVNHVHSTTGHPQRKGISPGLSVVMSKDCPLKHVKGASSVIQLPCVQPVTNVPLVKNLPVGARLQNFWQTWLGRGAGPKIVQILRGLHPPLSDPAKPHKVSHCHKPLCHSPQEQLPAGGIASALDKNAIELVHNQTSRGFFNRLFLVPKPNNKWRPILDLSKLNLFLKVEKFTMETPETIRTSLQQGEWVTSVDFKDAYFHILIQEQSRKYFRFHVQGRTYQFKALPFGLSTAPMEFTVLAKEVKLMAIHKGIRIHQYLDDWLVRARSHQTCLHHTQILVKMCQDLGWLVNLEKSELEPKQVFNFVGYQFDLRSGRVRPTPDRWQSLQGKIQTLLLLPACPVRQFMSLIGLLTEKQVHLGRLHMRPIQRHLKNNWRVPESLEKVIPLPRSLHPHLQWWLKESNVLQGQPGTKSGPFGLERVPRPMHQQNCPSGHRQYHSSGLHKQRRYEVGPAVCPTVENLDLVFPATSDSKSPTYPWPIKCDSREAIQAESDHPNRMAPPSGRFSKIVQQMAPASDRPICHKVQPQVTSVGLSSTGHPGCSSGCTHSTMGGSGCIRLPTDRHIGQSGGEVTRLPVQETHSDCPGAAQHALVLGLGDHVQSGPSQPAQSVNTALQSDPSQKSGKSKSPCMAPRATKIKEQSFSEAVAARIEAPQRRSTRSVYEAKWAIFTPQPLRAVGVLFSPMVSGWAGGRLGRLAGNSLSGLYLRNRKV